MNTNSIIKTNAWCLWHTAGWAMSCCGSLRYILPDQEPLVSIPDININSIPGMSVDPVLAGESPSSAVWEENPKK